MKYKTLVLCLIMVVSFSSIGMAKEKTILIIESYHSEYPWDASYNAGIRDVLKDEYKIINFQMDTKRLPKSIHKEMADTAWKLYKKSDPDLVVLGDDNALKLLGKKFSRRKIPVVYLGINQNPRVYGVASKSNITGVLERPLLKRSVAILNNILNEKPKKVKILFDSGTTSQASIDEIFKDKSMEIGGIKTDIELVGEYGQWKKIIKNLKSDGYDAFFIGLYHTIIDDKGKHVPADEIIKWSSENSPVPMFCFWDFAVGADKAIGGYVLFGQTQGRLAGGLIKEIFEGKSPGSIPPIFSNEGRYFYSRTQLLKWDLNLKPDVESQAEFVE